MADFHRSSNRFGGQSRRGDSRSLRKDAECSRYAAEHWIGDDSCCIPTTISGQP
jgi:hypothetical protein